MSQKEKSLPDEPDVKITMDRIRVKDLDGLRRLLENVNVMENVYSHFIYRPIMEAKMKMYPHDGGALVEGKRYWIYVTISSPTQSYDVALWKIVRYAIRDRRVYQKLVEFISIEG